MLFIALLLNLPIPAKNILIGRAYIELKCNDIIVFFTEEGEFLYKIKKIRGFRGVEYNVTTPGFNYEFFVEGNTEKLESNDVLYQYKNEKGTDCRIPSQPSFKIESDSKKDVQTYEIALYMKPFYQDYNNTLKQFKDFLNILSERSYVFFDKYNENKVNILDNCQLNNSLLKYKKANIERVDQGYRLGLYSTNNDFIVANLGSSNRNVINRVMITFSEKCDSDCRQSPWLTPGLFSSKSRKKSVFTGLFGSFLV